MATTNFISIGIAAAMLGVCTKTLRRWDAAGVLKPPFRTVGNHRRYERKHVLAMRDSNVSNRHHADDGKSRAVIYARVSSSRQKKSGDLSRQRDRARLHCEESGHSIAGEYLDVGSGLNDNRRGLFKMLRDAVAGRFDVVVVTYNDRLSRFGLNIIREFLGSWGVELEVMHPMIVNSSPHAELITDLTSILYSFMGKLYRVRRGQEVKDTKGIGGTTCKKEGMVSPSLPLDIVPSPNK